MYISPFPTLSLNDLWQQGQTSGLFPPLNTSSTSYYYRGANAIFEAVRLLQLSPGDNILLPAYHCGVEVEAVLAAGAAVKFYNVHKNLEADFNDLNQKIDALTKAIFVIHYFGFPQSAPFRKICEDKNLCLIEDCAHALYSRRKGALLGHSGDLSIFSFQKTLPVADGGALVVNRKDFKMVRPQKKPSLITVTRGAGLLWLEHLRVFSPDVYAVLNWFFVTPARILFKLVKMLPGKSFKVTTASTSEFDAARASLGISDLSLGIVKRTDSREIINRRRDNFQFLFDNLKSTQSVKVPFRDLPEGVCPLFFPVLVDDRDALCARLQKNGVGTFIFGKSLHASLPAGEFSTAEEWSQKNLCLPVHQDLNRVRLAYLLKILKVEIQEANEHTASYK